MKIISHQPKPVPSQSSHLQDRNHRMFPYGCCKWLDPGRAGPDISASGGTTDEDMPDEPEIHTLHLLRHGAGPAIHNQPLVAVQQIP